MRGTQQAEGWRVSFGRQATLRGCDGACALSVGATDSVRGATDSGQSALPMLGVRQCALSPFSSLPAVILDYRRLSFLPNTVSQHGASRCAEMRYASRYRSSLWRIFPPLGEIERRRAGLGCSWGARSARADLEQNCAFDGVHAALEEQRRCRSEHDRRGRLNDCQEHWGSISRSVRTVQGRIDALRVRRALSLRDISLVADIKLSILRECERT